MQVYTESIKPVSMSEKYDGVQGCWTGQELVTRTGGKINAPAWWTDGLPEKALVGELWIGRGEFEAVKALVQSGRSEGWERVCFMVFDGATPDDRLGAYARLVVETPVTSPEQADVFFEDVVAHGGEGIVVRDAQGCCYKRKPVQDDDGQVVGYTQGKGRYSGTIGGLVLKLRSGRELRLSSGLNRKIRQQPPAIGAIVQFAYSGLTSSGLPRFPRMLHERVEAGLSF